MEKIRGTGEHLLVVEDDESVRDMTTKILNALGYSVAAVASGEEGVDYLGRNQVHLVILDMLMSPGINGRETYERMLAFRPGQRAIVVSGFAESGEIKRILELGASHFLRKPFTLQELGTTVKRALLC